MAGASRAGVPRRFDSRYTAAMAKGLEKKQARIDAMNYVGKELARRAKRKCELCEAGEDLRPYDTDLDAEPSLETLTLLCERCRAVAGGRRDEASTLRFLENAIWSEHPQIAGTAKAMLTKVDADWARSALEMIS